MYESSTKRVETIALAHDLSHEGNKCSFLFNLNEDGPKLRKGDNYGKRNVSAMAIGAWLFL